MTHFYDAQARSYDWTRRFVLPGRGKLISELEIKPGETFLEIGCGTGWNLRALADLVGTGGKVVGLDVSRGMLERARARGLPPHVELREVDAVRIGPLSDRFDGILFSYSYTAIPEREKVLLDAISWLGPRGRIGIVDFKVRRGPLRWWGRIHSCDFSADPVPLLSAAGWEPRMRAQCLGLSYRLVAFRGRGV